MDPFIWWSKRNTRKRTFKPGEYVGFAAGAGPVVEPPPPEIQYLLQATFDAYTTPATPVTNGQVLAESGGDPQIEKGSTTVIDTDGLAELELRDQKSVAQDVNDTVIRKGYHITAPTSFAREVGLTQSCKSAVLSTGLTNGFLYPMGWSDTADQIDLQNPAGFRETGIQLVPYSLSLSLNGDTIESNLVTLSIPDVKDVYYKLTIVCADYDAGGQPGEGTLGWLFLVDDRPVFSHDVNGVTPLYPVFHAAQRGETAVDDIQVYIDTTPLATPNRSLFATDHADIADYVPEDGAAWTVETGGASTSGGNVVNGGAETHLTVAHKDGMKEMLPASGTIGHLFRYQSATDYWAAEVDATGAGNINEYISGTPTSRGALTGQTGRLILTDDGTNISSIGNGNVVSATSTAGNTATKSGIKLTTAGATVSWFCTRGGS